jgi:hypothetical protein
MGAHLGTLVVAMVLHPLCAWLFAIWDRKEKAERKNNYHINQVRCDEGAS